MMMSWVRSEDLFNMLSIMDKLGLIMMDVIAETIGRFEIRVLIKVNPLNSSWVP